MTMTMALLKAFRESGQTVYRVAKNAGLEKESLRLFVTEQRSLRLDKADKLAAYFGLELKGMVTHGPGIRRRK